MPELDQAIELCTISNINQKTVTFTRYAFDGQLLEHLYLW